MGILGIPGGYAGPLQGIFYRRLAGGFNLREKDYTQRFTRDISISLWMMANICEGSRFWV